MVSVAEPSAQPWEIPFNPALQSAEKVNSMRLLVAQALLPVLVLLHLSSMHS